ncbi:hypothetical protein B9Z55_000481 [Caenorhabditis nigoni]|uniref:Uncharacterized protein n=1 Tax=Caenorhabditis nigoni TaxID=1611254 RepID=A0A2G5VTB7_9PELO|nr:hypothetical protein B9Z55_000481 [Caenorhabditis nigoni]
MEFPKPHHTSTEQQVLKDLRIGEKYKPRCTFQGCIWLKSARQDCGFVGTPADAVSHAAKGHLQIHRHECKICHMKMFDECEVYLHIDSKCLASNWDDINSRFLSRDESITHRRVFNTSFEPSTREKHDEWQRSQNEEKRMRNQEPACPNTPGYDDVVEQTLAAAAAAQMASTSASGARSGHRESQRSQRRSRASSREPQVLETSIRSLPISMRSREGSIEQSYPEGYDPNARPRQFGFIPRDQAGTSSRQIPQDPRLAAQNQRSETRYQSPMDILYPEEPDTVMVEPTPEREADPSLLDPEIPFDFSRPPPPIPPNFSQPPPSIAQPPRSVPGPANPPERSAPSPPAAQPPGPPRIDAPGRSAPLPQAPSGAPHPRADPPRASRSEWTEMKPTTIAPADPPAAAPTRPVAQPPRSVVNPSERSIPPPPATQPPGIDAPGRSTPPVDPARASRPDWTETKPATFAPAAQPPRSVPDLIDPFVRSPPPAAASPRPVPAPPIPPQVCADPPRETKPSTIAQPSQSAVQSPRPVPAPGNPPRVAEPVRVAPPPPAPAQPSRSIPTPSDPPGRSPPPRSAPIGLSERALARLAGFAPRAVQPESAPRQTGRQITRADYEGPASRTRTKSTEGYTLPVFRQAPPAARRSNIRARSTDGEDARKPGPRAKSRDPEATSSRAAAFNQADNDVLGVATDGSGPPVKRGRGRPRKDQSVEGPRAQTPEAGRINKPVGRQPRGTPSREQSREPEGPSFRRGQTPEPEPSNRPVGRPPRGPSREQSREPEGPSFRRGQTPELPAEGPPRRPPGRPRKTPSREPSVEAQPPRRGPGRPRTMSREPSEDRDASRERIAGVATAAGMKRTPNYSRDPSRDRASREPSVEASEEVIVAERVGRTGMTTCCIRTPGEFRTGPKRGVSYTRSRSRDSADEGGMRLREMPSTLSSETADSDAHRGRPNEPQLQGKPTVKVARGRSRMSAMLEDFPPIPASVPKPTSSSRPNAAREDRRQRALNRLRVAVENGNGGVETSRANGSTSQQEKRSRVRTPEPSVLHAEIPTPPGVGRIGEGPQEKRPRRHSPEAPLSSTSTQATPSFPPGISLPSTSRRATSSGDDEDRPAWNGPSTSSASVSNGQRRESTASEFAAPPPHVSSPSTSSSYSHHLPAPAPIAETPAATSSFSGLFVDLARRALESTGRQDIPNPLASPEDVAPVSEARRMDWEEYGRSLNDRSLQSLPTSTAPPPAAGGCLNLQESSRAPEAAPTPPGIHQNLPHRQSSGLRHSGHYQPPPERHQLQSFREAQGIQEQAHQTSRRRQSTEVRGEGGPQSSRDAAFQTIQQHAEEAHQTAHRRRQSTEREDWYSGRPHRERQESKRWQERDRGAWQGGDYSRRRSRSRNDDDGGGYNHGHGGGGARGQGNYLGRNFDPNFHQRHRDHRDHNGGGGYRRY